MVLNFCLIGKIQYTFLVPKMIESCRQTFMPPDFHAYSDIRSTQSVLHTYYS